MSKKRKAAEQVETASADLVGERREQLRALFPEAFSEGKVDFEKLRATLGDLVDEGPERYSFTWAGKRDAIRLLQTPSRATLIPCPEESVNFDTTQHLFIEGDNLEVLKLLYRSYAGRVKLIYIDPPYNTGNDRVYRDDFSDPLQAYLQMTEQRDAEGNLLTTNPEVSGRFHSDWLSMMYPRLFLARQMLSADGSIFVSIDDHEVFNLRLVLNEIFGEENFVANIVWQKRTSPDARATIGAAHDSILVYARSLQRFKEALGVLPLSEERRREYKNPDNDPRGDWASRDITGQTGHATPSQYYEITTPSGRKYRPPEGRCWAISEHSFGKLVADGRIWFGRDGASRPRLKLFLSETKGMATWTWWPNDEVGHNQEATKELNDLMGVGDVFDNPKPTRLIKRLLQLTTDPKGDDLVMDFFAGSCTSAHAALQLNREDGGRRRFIMVQLPEPTPEESTARKGDFATIAEIGKERIRRVIRRLQDEEKSTLDLKQETEEPEDLGCRVFRLAESHYRRWRGVEEKRGDVLADEMEVFTDPLVPGWKPIDVVYEVLLKEGLSLTSRIEELPKKRVKKNKVYRVTDDERGQSLLVCLDGKLEPETPRALGLGKDDVFVCRDAALTDELAANLALQCRLKTL